jgi:site-specific recombinase XerD
MVGRKVASLIGRPCSPHQLRHTFASVLTERGANMFHVQRLMRHERLDTTSVYIHLRDETLLAELEKHLG